PYYHTASDTPEKVQYDRMARVVAGLAEVITDIIGGTRDSLCTENDLRI
ncbi:MAG: hypothetical protein GTN81_13010, partial [Proteobacteria bacterium]|nr:hypothetical protein [Pseudomonadota bacterium]